MTASSLTVAFVVKGFLTQATMTSPGWVKVAHHGGQLDVLDRVTEYADIVEEAWHENLSDVGWGGVWDYEVSEVLGVRVGRYTNEHDDMPEHSTVREWVKELVNAGLDQSLKSIVEVAGCIRFGEGIEAGAPDEIAHFWSVYTRKPDENGDRLAECVGDYRTKELAMHKANELFEELGGWRFSILNDRTWSQK
jgi:hypothetical protein